ncbi:RDD family protein [Streptomyces uncialis]|uniref:RDD family protein n=1 Tax=Streptomyces uncialis TaxID=1048205 RepID=UPI0033FA3D39
MSAPTPAPGDDRPREGYYPDPSIPGYVRYWNGAAWVPGTSRPAPTDGASPHGPAAPAAPATPGASAAPAASVQQTPAAPATPATPGTPVTPAGTPAAASAPVEETGPVFFDEEPQPEIPAQSSPHGVRPEPASAWGADTSQQSGFGGDQDRKVSWGGPAPTGPDPRTAPAPDPAPPVPAAPAEPAPDDGSSGVPSGPTFSGAGAPGGAPDKGTMTFRRPSGPGPAGVPAQGGAAPVPGQEPRTPGAPAPVPSPQVPRQGTPPATPFPPAPHQPGHQPPAAHQPGHHPHQAPAAPQPLPPAAPAPAQQPAPAPAPAPAPVHQATPPAAPAPAAAPPAHPAAPAPPRPGTPRPAPGLPAASAAPVVPHGPSSPVPPQGPAAPVAPGPDGGGHSWAQQVHQLARPDAAAPGGEPPVVPWKPPTEDVFAAAARAQAASRPAGLGRRLLARLVDTVVMGAVTAAAAVPLGIRALDHIDGKLDAAKLSGETVTVWLLDGTTATYLAAVLAVLLLTGVLYEVLPTAKWGRTPGKRLFGLTVQDIEGHQPPGFGGALRRYLVLLVPSLLVVGVIGVLWCVVDRPWRQCWHDKAARTFVAR